MHVVVVAHTECASLKDFYQFGAAVADAVLPPRNVLKEYEKATP